MNIAAKLQDEGLVLCYDKEEETSSHTKTIVVVLTLIIFIFLMCFVLRRNKRNNK